MPGLPTLIVIFLAHSQLAAGFRPADSAPNPELAAPAEPAEPLASAPLALARYSFVEHKSAPDEQRQQDRDTEPDNESPDGRSGPDLGLMNAAQDKLLAVKSLLDAQQQQSGDNQQRPPGKLAGRWLARSSATRPGPADRKLTECPLIAA